MICKDCGLHIKECICKAVATFFEENKHLMASQDPGEVQKDLPSRFRSLYKALVTGMATLPSKLALATTVGSITLSGTVPQATSIVVTPTAGYNALDLTTTAVNQQVATVQEKNNTTLGYKVTLTSQNAGILKNGSIDQVAYTAKYNGTSVTLSTTPVQVTTGAPQNTVVNVNKPLTISYTGQAADAMMAGVYSDILTFTISSP